MSPTDLAVIGGGLALIAFLLWFFFGPKTGKAAVFQAGVQEAGDGGAVDDYRRDCGPAGTPMLTLPPLIV